MNIGFEYNTSGKLLEILLPDGAAITYGYNAITEMLEHIIVPDGGGITYSYDGSLLNKTTWAGLIEGSVEYEYDNDFQVIAQTVNGENAVGYTYDNDGLLMTAGALGITRNAENGMLTGTTLGNVTDSVTYNTFGETKTYQAKVNGSAVLATNYQTDALGRITTKTEIVNGESHTYTYTYDTIGQLTEVYRDGSLYGHYEYDANGNRVAYNGASGTASGVYDDQDRMLSYGGNSYQYTANGELKTKTNSAGTTSYIYDVLGNLKEVDLVDGTKITYVIDGANRRIGKKVNGTLVQGFLYQDSLNPVAEIDANGNLIARFVYGTRSNVPDYLIRGGMTYRIISDHLGSVRLVVNAATGDIVQKMEYDEFGRVLTDTNPGFQPFGFAGGIYDGQTGLVRFGARDYDAEIGRWTCKDPIGFDGGDGNLYCYCQNDPVNLIDPFGEDAVDTLWFLGNVWSYAFLEPSFIGEVTATGVTIGAIGYLIWEGGNYVYDQLFAESNANTDGCNIKPRSKNPPSKRDYSGSKKGAYEKAKRAGKGKEPVHHPDGEHGPHYHPDVAMPKEQTPKMPNPHDHYYYPKSKI